MYTSERVDVQRRLNGYLAILGARGRMVAIASVAISCHHACGSSQARSNKGSTFGSLGRVCVCTLAQVVSNSSW